MKSFLKIFFGLLIFEIVFGVFSLFINMHSNFPFLGKTLNFINHLLCFPLNIFDESYPFYALGSIGFILILILINVFFQTTIIFIILCLIKWRKTKSQIF